MKPKGRFLPLIITLIAITVLVTVHEFGHFLMCKLFNIKTPIFSIGFGPRLFGITIGQTLFQIAAIPLGGYVSINEVDMALTPYYQKMIIILAGVGFNLIFACLLLFLVLYSRKGKPVPIIATIVPGSPADNAGLEIGDRIIKIEDIQVDENMQKLMRKIAEHPNEQTRLTISRDDEVYEIPVRLGAKFGGRVGALGVTFDIDTSARYSILHALQNAMSATWAILTETSRVFFGMFKRRKRQSQLAGPVGVITGTAETAKEGWAILALLMSSLSIQLAFFNTLPVPLFDGGKAVLYTVEALMGQPLTPEIIGLINLITMILLFALFFYLTIRDVRTMRNKQK